MRLPLLANRRVRRGLIITAVLAVVWLLSSLAVAYALTCRHGPRTAEGTPEISDWELESHRLKTSDGEELGAWFVEGMKDGPSVLILHGHKGRRWNSLRLGRLLSLHGCSILMISHRAHGDSTGEFDDVGYSARRDVLAGVELLERRRPGRPVIVDGNSLGSAAAIFAAGELGHRVAAYILESPYQDLKIAVWNRIENALPRGLSHVAYGGLRLVSPLFLPHLDAISPVNAIGAIPADVPVLILAGGRPPGAASGSPGPLRPGRLARPPGLRARRRPRRFAELVAGVLQPDGPGLHRAVCHAAAVTTWFVVLLARETRPSGESRTDLHERKGLVSVRPRR
jgi:pimeloyl-ACP methyl ester carboxylesterase